MVLPRCWKGEVMIGDMSCPRFPEIWTPEIEAIIKSHAMKVYPEEAVGIIENGQYVELDNLSKKPYEDVRLSDEDLIRVANSQLFFHSHPDGIPCPSEADMIYQQQLGIPFAIVTLPDYDVFVFGDTLEKQPLIGRGFRHGVHDCYALMRDWYQINRGIDVMNKPRGWEWWREEGKSLYLDNLQEAGFRLLPLSEANETGDVLLFNFHFKIPMHGALVMEDKHLILHHACGSKGLDRTRLSRMDLRSRYWRFATYALRYDK